MSYTITSTEFKAYFDRGQFSFGETLPSIRDKDIDAAIAEAVAVFNFGLYPTEEIGKLALSYLTAHYLTLDINAANSGGQAVFTQTSRSADGLSESVQIPVEFQDGDFAFYVTTYFGQKWLSLTKPYLGGAVYAVYGATTP